MYVAEVGKLNGRYLPRVLRDGVLIWQNSVTYKTREQALRVANKYIAWVTRSCTTR